MQLNTSVDLSNTVEDGLTLSGLRADYDAVFLSTGTHDSMRARIPGEELGGVLHGAEYLRQLSLAQLGAVDAQTSASIQMPQVGERVAVIGAGPAGPTSRLPCADRRLRDRGPHDTGHAKAIGRTTGPVLSAA